MKRWLERRKRVRYIPQMEVTECGAACLAMVLDYHGASVPLSEVRSACGIGRDGVSAARIYTAGKRLGLAPTAFRAELSHLFELALPAILHWEFNHFVVLERIDAHAATIVDPGTGRRTLTREQLSSAFTGVVITFKPTDALVRRPRRSLSLGRYLRALAGLRAGAVGVVASALLLEVLSLAFPAANQVLIDHVFVAQRDAWMWPILLLVCGSAVCILVTAAVRDRIVRRLHFALDLSLMSGFTKHLLGLPLAFFQQRSAGDLLQRVDAQRSLRDVTLSVVTAGLDGLLMLGYAAMMLAYDLRVGTAIIVLALLRACTVLALRESVAQATAAQLAEHGKELSAVVEPLAAPEMVRAFGAEGLVQEQYERRLVLRLNAELRRETLNERGLQLSSVIDGFAHAAVIWLGGHEVLADEMTLGVFAGLITLQALFQKPLASLVEGVSMLTRARGVLARIDDVLETTAPAEGTVVRHDLTGAITLRDVGYRYDAHAPYVCRNVDLQIRAGEKVAIVGRSGQGKTTLLRMLASMITPTEGRILLDDEELCQLSPACLAAHVGVVLQEPFLLDDSVRQNLALGLPDAPEERLRWAARIACIEHVIDALPEGLETRLGDNALKLSGGERQRLALARALVRRPKILLLDEATSSLDLVTEARVHKNLGALACTRVIVAHRMQTVRDADRILVVEGGRIVEQGSYDALRTRPGVFQALLAGAREVRT